jgi:altronate dehydratase small subunit
MNTKLALKVNDSDNVATVFASGVTAETLVEVRDKSGCSSSFTVGGAIPYGHKIALRDILAGEQIIKYGEEIGVATANIKTGGHVHVHNLDSMRGRGDLQGGAQ